MSETTEQTTTAAVENPFQAPESENINSPTESGEFADMPFDKLKKLYYRSCNVTGFGVLLILGALYVIGASFALTAIPQESGGSGFAFSGIFIGLGILNLAGAVGCFMRASWGRILGILLAVISLINIPIGTIIGIMGLFAFIGAPELFGPNRILHKDLKAEFKAQKAAQKARLKNA